MATGIKFNNTIVQVGNINTQAIPDSSQINFGNAFTVGKDGGTKQIITSDSFKNVTKGNSQNSPFVNPNVSLTNVEDSKTKQINIGNEKVDTFFGLTSLTLKGISEQRPEILALTDFQPIYDDGQIFNNIGEFIELQISARKLRIANIKKLFEKLETTNDAKVILDNLKNSYSEQISLAQSEVDFFVSMFEAMNNTKKSFRIKTLTSFSNQNILNIRKFKDFFIEELLFSEESFREFSNTKVMGQFLIDLERILSTYSHTLFNFTSVKRFNDLTSTRYIKDFLKNRFKFNIENFQSITTQFPINMGNITTFSSFISKLPSDTDSRIKIMLTLLSKEMRVSQGLGRKNINKTLLSVFGLTNNDRGNPFDDIIGKVGEKIVDPIIGDNSMVSLLAIEGTNNEKVLPFESSYVLDLNNKIYKPGSNYLVDSIVLEDPIFNTDNIFFYKNRVEKISNNFISTVRELLNLNDESKNLFCDELFNIVINDFGGILNVVVNARKQNGNQSEFSVDEQIMFPVAILSLSNSDIKLKAQLFQLMLLVGLNGKIKFGEGVGTQPEPFFVKLSQSEISKLGDLSELGLSSGDETDITNNFAFNNKPNNNQDNQNNNLSINKDTPTSEILSVQTAIELMIDKIIDRLFLIINQGKTDYANTGLVISYTKQEFRQILSNNMQIFEMMTDFISVLESKVVSDNGYYFSDSFKSRYNFLTPSTRALMVFEIYASFAKKYVDVGLNSSTQANSISFIANISDMEEVLDGFESIIGQSISFGNIGFAATPKPAGQQGFAANPIDDHSGGINIQSLKDLKDKFLKEDLLMIEMVNRLEKTTDLIIKNLNNLLKFFATNGKNAEKLEELSKTEITKQKSFIASEAQIRLSQFELDDIKDYKYSGLTATNTNNSSKTGNFSVFSNLAFFQAFKTNNLSPLPYINSNISYPIFFDDSDVPFETRDLMFNILGKEKYNTNNGKNLKILTVGIPYGFSEHLINVLGVDQSDFDDAENNEKDLIEINVYRKDIEFEDIVFKPKKYIFEMSRFVSNNSIIKNYNSSFSSNFDVFTEGEIFTKDYSNYIKGSKQSQDSIFQSSKYEFLSDNQKKSLVENHVTSNILGLYIKLLTGINFSESSFLINKNLMENSVDENSKKLFKKMIETYVKGIAGSAVTLAQLRKSSPQIDKLLNKIDVVSTQQSFKDKIEPIQLPGLSRSAAVSLTEDLITFIKAFSPKTILSGGQAHRDRITSPKTFERIFHIPVDPDDFEIDDQITNESPVAAIALGNFASQALIGPTEQEIPGLKIVKNSIKENIDFEEFIVTINTVGKTVK